MVTGFVVVTATVVTSYFLLRRQIKSQYERIKAREVKRLEERAHLAELLAEIEFVAEERKKRAAVEKELEDLRKRLGQEVMEQQSHIKDLEQQSTDQGREIERAREVQSMLMDMYGNNDAGLLHAACAGPAALAEAFLERGANREAVGARGTRPLHHAAWHGQVEVIKVLVEHGADVDAGTETDSTPLFQAIQGDQLGAAGTLLELSANVNASNTLGRTPLHAAVLYNRPNSLQMVELLLAADASIKARDGQGRTALAMAEQEGLDELADLLRQHGAEE